jgi:hypothetical protein
LFAFVDVAAGEAFADKTGHAIAAIGAQCVRASGMYVT